MKDLRQAKNDLQTIIDNQAEVLHRNSAYELILAENLIYSVQDLKNHFACVSAADDVKEVERLRAENIELICYKPEVKEIIYIYNWLLNYGKIYVGETTLKSAILWMTQQQNEIAH